MQTLNISLNSLRGKSAATRLSHRLVWCAIIIGFVVIILGAFTRLRDAGLGCPDWPTCYGHILWPQAQHEIHAANQAFPDTPVETDKTWPEMVHRYFASGLGLFILAIFVIGLIHRRQDHPLGLPILLVGIVILQGMFGMWTVTLKLWPQVVTAHLLGGFTTLSLLWLLAQNLGNYRWYLPTSARVQLNKLKPWSLLLLLIVIAQIILGGWTSSNYAALACPDFPTCQQVWLPPADFTNGFNFFQNIGPNYLGGQLDGAARIAIHFVHRVGAAVTTVSILLICLALWLTNAKVVRRFVFLLLSVLLVQVLLGISNVLFSLPLPVAVAHNAVAACLLLTVITLNHRIFSMRALL